MMNDLQEIREWLAAHDPHKTPVSPLVQQCAIFTARSLMIDVDGLLRALTHIASHFDEPRQQINWRDSAVSEVRAAIAAVGD